LKNAKLTQVSYLLMTCLDWRIWAYLLRYVIVWL
jgi:hypothetical protein